MNLLFVCSRNQWRSPTAEKLFAKAYNTRSAGTAESAKNKLTEKQIIWADIIFVMESKHKRIILDRYDIPGIASKIITLDIPDEYRYMDEELIAMLNISVPSRLASHKTLR